MTAVRMGSSLRNTWEWTATDETNDRSHTMLDKGDVGDFRTVGVTKIDTRICLGGG